MPESLNRHACSDNNDFDTGLRLSEGFLGCHNHLECSQVFLSSLCACSDLINPTLNGMKLDGGRL
jgi:hypothetical protein